MHIGLIIMLVLGIPIILFPVVLIWYINIGGIYMAIKESREKKLVRTEESKRITLETKRGDM